MKHILICPHHLVFGGSQLGIHHWAKYLDRSRYLVTILAMGRGGLSEKFEAHYPVVYDGDGYPNIEEHIREIKPDLLHAGPPGGKDMEYISRAARLVPVTQTVMCPRVVSNYNDVVRSVVLSDYVVGLQPRTDRVVKIDLPFDRGDYEKRYDRAHFGLPEGKLIVGSFGNGRKENAHFMKIARRYKGTGVHFVIKTDKKYRYLFGRSRVTVINRFLSEDEKMSLFGEMDIFMYPTSNESYGLVFLEAMSARLPIITYDDTANGEVVGGGGVLAPLGDLAAMAGVLERLSGDEGERRRLGEAGYRLFKERNDPKVIAGKYEDLFEEALAAGRLENGGERPRP